LINDLQRTNTHQAHTRTHTHTHKLIHAQVVFELDMVPLLRGLVFELDMVPLLRGLAKRHRIALKVRD